MVLRVEQGKGKKDVASKVLRDMEREAALSSSSNRHGYSMIYMELFCVSYGKPFPSHFP